MSRLFLFFAALATVLVAPLASPAHAAAASMEQCSEGHGGPAPGDGKGNEMDHQACCVAVDPGKLVPATKRFEAKALAVRSITDLTIESMSSGIDPPPPRLV